MTIKAYLHMVHTSGDALSKNSLYGQRTGNIHLFFPVNLLPPTLHVRANSLQDDTRSKRSWDTSTNQTIRMVSWSEPGYPVLAPISSI